MKKLNHFLRRLNFLCRRAALDRELAEELEFHRAMKERENEFAGLSAAEAQAAAQRQMGNLTQAKESSRDTWSFLWLEQLWQDLSVALRSLRRDRSFTIVAILSLALGIGANTAIFTALNTVLLEPLPYPQPQQLYAVTQPMVSNAQDQIFDPEFEAWRNENRVFKQLACWSGTAVDFSGQGSPERLLAASVSGNFLETLRISPAIGRNFSPREDRRHGPQAVLLTDRFWRRHFSADLSVLGKSIKLNGIAYPVVGVLPASFHFPGNLDPELLLPVQLPMKPNWGASGLLGLHVIGRLASDVPIAHAVANLRFVDKLQEPNMLAFFRDARRHLGPLQITPLQTYLAGHTRWILLFLFASVIVLLGIACANVVGLQLARAAARQSELAVRAALGAGRSRLMRFLLTESILIAFSGGACGVLLAWVLVRLVGATTLLHLTTTGPLRINGIVLLFTLSVSLVAGLACGLLPALLASRQVLYTAIKSNSARGGPSQLFGLGSRLRGFFVVGQVALTLLLLVSAFLLLRSFQHVLAVNLGFQPEHVLSFQTDLPNLGHQKPAQLALTLQSELDRIAALPGVRSIGAGSLPLTHNKGLTAIAIEGQPASPPGQAPATAIAPISPDYFQTLNIPVLAGRAFSIADSSHSVPVAIVNVSFARRFFGNADPLGKRLHCGGSSGPWTTIVGVVADIHADGRETDPVAELYLPITQDQDPDLLNFHFGIALRTTLPPATLLPAIRKVIAKTDPTQPIFDIATMQQRLSDSTSSRRTQTALLSSFAFMALCLAAIGVYGILSYAVTQTTREIGIRMALGAQKGTVLGSVICRGVLFALGGIAIGLAVSLVTVRYLASFLFHVKPLDWISFVGGAALLLVLAILASYLPARRAASIDPMTALRYE